MAGGTLHLLLPSPPFTIMSLAKGPRGIGTSLLEITCNILEQLPHVLHSEIPAIESFSLCGLSLCGQN